MAASDWDSAHLRWERGVSGVEVSFDENTRLATSKDLFLCNDQNKEKIVKFLGDALEEDGCKVIYDDADADLLICLKTVRIAEEEPVAIIADHTDILVLLLHHVEKMSKPTYIVPLMCSKKCSVLSITGIKEQLPTNFKKNLLFLHAFMGCDTTSRIHGFHKGSMWKKMASSKRFDKIGSTFSIENQNKEAIIQAGEETMLVLYGNKNEVSVGAPGTWWYSWGRIEVSVLHL